MLTTALRERPCRAAEIAEERLRRQQRQQDEQQQQAGGSGGGGGGHVPGAPSNRQEGTGMVEVRASLAARLNCC